MACRPDRTTTVLKITTSDKKKGFLLIEVFRKLFNTQNNGHQGSILGGSFLISGVEGISQFG